MPFRHLILSLFLTFLTTEASAMNFATVKLLVSRNRENIFSEEFIAANEAVVDYLATLPRPTEALKLFEYSCQVKGRYINTSVQTSPGATTQGSVPLLTVYEIKDCTQLD